MKKKERDRQKAVVYESYMAGHARGEKTEVILERLGKKFHRSPRTIQNWIYEVSRSREAQQEALKANITNLMSEFGSQRLYVTCDESGRMGVEF